LQGSRHLNPLVTLRCAQKLAATADDGGILRRAPHMRLTDRPQRSSALKFLQF